MRPPQTIVHQCAKQTEDLFDYFINLNELDKQKALRRDFHEKNEVESYITVERDSSNSRQASVPDDFVSRSPVLSNIDSPYNQNFKKQAIPEDLIAPVLPGHASPPGSRIPPVTTKHPLDNFGERQRERTLSVGPTEDQLKEAASFIATIGDEIDKKYGSMLKKCEKDLIDYLKEHGRNMAYETFAAHVNDLIGEDRNWTNFMCVMHLSRRVIIGTQALGTNAINYFRRFIPEAFAEQIAESHDVVNFVNNESRYT